MQQQKKKKSCISAPQWALKNNIIQFSKETAWHFANNLSEKQKIYTNIVPRILLFPILLSSLALMILVWRCYEDIFTKHDLLNELMNNKGVFRTSPVKILAPQLKRFGLEGVLKMICETWHVTRDMWLVTHDTWQMTHDMW